MGHLLEDGVEEGFFEEGYLVTHPNGMEKVGTPISGGSMYWFTPPNNHSSQVWARQKPGTRNSIQEERKYLGCHH